jgi:molybdopterin-guanine dinucleotide biosynthesis protein A
MGVPKASLPFGAETMLQRILRLLGEVVQPLVVVSAPAQDLPPLPAGVLRTCDRHHGLGPLEGLRAGLSALGDGADAAYATSCDVPLLQPAFVRALIRQLGSHQVVVPVDGQFHFPLAAVYRTDVVPELESLLAAGQRRPVALYDRVATCRVPVEELRDDDPQLQTLANLNRPEDYVTALQIAGLEIPAEFDLF